MLMVEVTVGLLVTLQAREGKTDELAEFLASARALVESEPETLSWFGFRIDESRFGIFDTFADSTGRAEHLDGPVAEALLAKADELLSEPPAIELVDVLAAKLPSA
jgi:quinol monooxygenase YgiN